MKPKVIAFYLPQYHPIPENNRWWSPGFTEWTSVAKAKPLFKGHVQPKIPADLGFYDLRLSDTREEQALIAKEYGIYGFCYYHYWFNGKQLMNRPFDEIINSGEPDFPFCLAWANHSWYRKDWSNGNNMLSGKSELLIEQTYGGREDYVNNFYSLLEAFKDQRYIRVKDKLLFMIYDASGFKDFKCFAEVWNELSIKEGLPGFYFITHACTKPDIEKVDQFLSNGYEGVNVSLHRMPFKNERNLNKNFLYKIKRRIRTHFRAKPDIVLYSKALKWMDGEILSNSQIYPSIVPNWDHTPRSGRFGRVFQNCTPELFRKHIKMIFRHLLNRDNEDKIVFLKSWNEWGEGNYIEPDLEYGRDRLSALKEELELFNKFDDTDH